MRFDTADVGVVADGAFGHSHIRDVLAELMARLATDRALGASQRSEAFDLARELKQSMSDDASEEDDAIDLLNTVAVFEGVSFTMHEGDLVVTAEGEES